MSLQAKKTYVMRITYPISGSVSYFSDWSELALDGNVYENIVTSWGRIGYYSDTLEGEFQRGSFDVQIANGQKIQGESFAISPTAVWNNALCEIRLYTFGFVIFEQCLPIVTGKIKNFNINNDMIEFSVEPVDSRDDILLPTIVCEDNTILSDGDAQEVPTSTSGDNKISFTTGGASIFKVGEMVLFTYETAFADILDGPYEYAIIKEIDSTNTTITLKEDYPNSHGIILVEKAFRAIPSESVGKTLPIQIGDLTDITSGVFGKTITTSEKAGRKFIVMGTHELKIINNIGIWDSGTKRYFVGNGGISGANVDYEYEIGAKSKFISFVSDTQTKLNSYLSTTDGILEVDVLDPLAINWVDCSDIDDVNQPELITNNVIGIGSELLLVMKKPTAGTALLLQRGFGGTEVLEHLPGVKVFQADKYADKNIITFREFFQAKSVTSIFTQSFDLTKGTHPTDYGIEGKLENIAINDSNSAILNMNDYHHTGTSPLSLVFDMHFQDIDIDSKVIQAIVGIDGTFQYQQQTDSQHAWFVVAIADPSQSSEYDSPICTFDHTTGHNILQISYAGGQSGTITLNTAGTIQLTPKEYSANDPLNPDQYDPITSDNNNTLNTDLDGFSLSVLKDLSKRWRIYFYSTQGFVVTITDGVISTLTKIGVWVDFFVDFTKHIVVSSLKGRKVTELVSALTGEAVGDACEHPLSVCATLLMEELGYEYADFGSGWTIEGYDWTHETVEVLLSFYAATWRGGVYGNNRFVIVSDNDDSDTVAMFSDDGYIWVRGSLGDNEVRWVDVTFSSSLLLYVAVGATDGGVNGSVMTSPTGQSWTVIPGIPNHDWRGVVWSPRLSLFVAVGEDDTMTSPDGTTWTDRVPASADFWKSVCIDEGDTLICAVGTDAIMTSINGIDDWASRTPATASVFWLGVTHGNDLFVAVGYNGSNETKIQTSPDGTTWTARTPAVGDFTAAGITFGSGLFYVVSDGEHSNVMVSADGITWTMEDTNYTVNRQNAVYGDEKFIAISSLVSVDFCTVSRYTAVVTVPCAFSYGVDDKRKKGFEFVSEIANHHNYLLTKNYWNQLEMTNIYDIYNDTGVGNEIKIEDILFLAQNSQRRMVLYQTGNELIYNDIVIKYSRNNSTGEYQKVYTLPDDFTLAKSSKTLRQVRDEYYDGKKRTLEIESPYIYDSTAAQHLAETKANEFAEVHLYTESYVDFDHYTDINSLDEQYKVGGVIYLTGTANGITFDSDRKFYITSTTVEDKARELNINMKSVDPCHMFQTA